MNYQLPGCTELQFEMMGDIAVNKFLVFDIWSEAEKNKKLKKRCKWDIMYNKKRKIK